MGCPGGWNGGWVCHIDVFSEFAHLEEIDVLPAHMNKGVGSALINGIIQYAKDHQKTHLSLRTC